MPRFPKSIGQIGAGKKRPSGAIDIATIQSLVRKGIVGDIVQNYGQIVVVEYHHISAFSFEQVLKACKAKYILGLTATPKRRDGHHPIILMQCGPIVEAPKDANAHAPPVSKELRVKNTAFTMPLHAATPTINELYEALTHDHARNQVIVQDVINAVSRGGFPLVLTERAEHIERPQFSWRWPVTTLSSNETGSQLIVWVITRLFFPLLCASVCDLHHNPLSMTFIRECY